MPHAHTGCELHTERRGCAQDDMKKYTLYIIHWGSRSHPYDPATTRSRRKGQGL